MAIDQLDVFMRAIAQQESGGRWDAVGPYTGPTYGRAVGRWQIMEKIWPGWAAEAGIPGASWEDPAAQEHVARFKMTQYYRRYGSWPLVAIAWFAGPGRANTAAREGIDAVGGISDVLGTDVRTYVNTMMQGMDSVTAGGGQREYGGGRTEGTGPTTPVGPPSADNGFRTQGLPDPAPTRDPNQEFLDSRRASSETMASIMQTISDMSRKNEGGRVLNVSALFGDVFEQDDADTDTTPNDDEVEEVA